MTDDTSLPFHRIAVEELKAIQARRSQACGAAESAELDRCLVEYEDLASATLDRNNSTGAVRFHEQTKKVRLAALDMHLAGIAFSGGGIRSATFAVGVLQGLASLKLLRRFDYISTVSGGGYAAAWLAAWIKRDGDPLNVERQLHPSRVTNAEADRGRNPEGGLAPNYLEPLAVVDEEPEPLYHLREYSSFMMPRPGIFSPDTWVILAIWARNLLINSLQILPLTMLVVILSRAIVFLYAYGRRASDRGSLATPGRVDWLILACSLAAVAGGFFVNALNLRAIRARAAGRVAPGEQSRQEPGASRPFFARFGWPLPSERGEGTRVGSLRLIVLLMLGGYVGFTSIISRFRGLILERLSPPLQYLARDDSYGSTPWFVAEVLFLGLTVGLLGWAIGGAVRPRGWSRSRFAFAAAVAGIILGVLVKPAILQGLISRLRLAAVADHLDLWLAVQVVSLGGSLGLFAFAIGRASRLEGWFRPKFVLAAAISGAIGGLLFWFLEGNFLASQASSTPTRLGTLTLATLSEAIRFTSFSLMDPSSSAGLAVLAAPLALLDSTPAFSSTDLAVFAAPFSLVILVVAMVGEVAIIGWRVDEAEREWWARLSAFLLLTAIGWIAVFATILYLPPRFLGLIGANPASGTAVAAGWLAVTTAGVKAGRTILAGLKGVRISLAIVAAVAPPIFLVGLLVGVSLLVHLLDWTFTAPANRLPDWAGAHAFADLLASSIAHPWSLGIVLLLTLGAMLVGAWLVDVNLFSMNSMYMNRIVRCYLGASRPKGRWADRWGADRDPRAGGGAPIRSLGVTNQADGETGFDLGDDLPLKDLDIDRGPGSLPYRGPYPLINTSLNLVAGRELATRERKCASFLFTPKHCGSRETGYTPIAPLESGARGDSESRYSQLSLGRVIAISGASVDPNMNYYQSPGLTAMLTVLNARLGYWVENPRLPEQRERASSIRGPSYTRLLVDELLGRTDQDGSYVHLSDGGHFENLGVYELIRRRCRYIVACDAGEDDKASDENLANLVRVARIDFGVRILMDTAPLALRIPGRQSQSHVVVGQIRYDDVDNGQMPGLLIYLKVTMTGDEPSDLQNYAALNPRFPNDPSDLRQIFGEAQFESYRALGDHIARVAFEDAAKDLEEAIRSRPDRNRADRKTAEVGLPTLDGPEKSLRSREIELEKAREKFRLSRRGRGVPAPSDAEVEWQEAKDRLGWLEDARDVRLVNLSPEKAVPPRLASAIEDASRRLVRATNRLGGTPQLPLGEFLDREAFGKATKDWVGAFVAWAEVAKEVFVDRDYVRDNRTLFALVSNRWSDQEPEQLQAFLESTKGWVELLRDLREDVRLADLSRELYPEWFPEGESSPFEAVRSPDDTPSERRRAELHAVAQMLQIMENAWMSLRLQRKPDRPMNRGWANVFRRWANTRTFHQLWPTLRAEFSTEFVAFCEAELHLVSTPRSDRVSSATFNALRRALIPTPNRSAAPLVAVPEVAIFRDLVAEMTREWPTGPDPGGAGTRPPDRTRPGTRGAPPRGSKDVDPPEPPDMLHLLAHAYCGMNPIVPGRGVRGKLDPGSKPLEPQPMLWLLREDGLDGERSAGIGRPAVGFILFYPEGLSLNRVGKAAPRPRSEPTPESHAGSCPDLRLVVWIRPAYRSMGIGTRCVERAIEKVEDEARPPRIFVYYPSWLHGGGAANAVASWRKFFSVHDFRDFHGQTPGQAESEPEATRTRVGSRAGEAQRLVRTRRVEAMKPGRAN